MSEFIGTLSKPLIRVSKSREWKKRR